MPLPASDALPLQSWVTAIAEGHLPGGHVEERSSVRRYGVSMLATVTATAITLAFASKVGGAVFPAFFAAVVVSALYGGTAPGVLSIVLAGASVVLFFPIQSASRVLAEIVRLASFGGAALLVLTLLRAARAAIQRAEQGEREARQLAEQLQEQAIELEHQIDQSQSLAQELEISTQELVESGEEARRARDEAEASERRYRMLFDSNPLPLWVFDQETLAFLAVNQAAIEHYGYTREDFLGMTVKDIRPPEDIHALLGALAPPGESTWLGLKNWGEFRHRKKDGTVIIVQVTTHPLTFSGHPAELVLALDVTDRKRVEEDLRRSEEQLRHAQKLDAVGQLAGGVAHDFNNLLTAVKSYSEFLLADMNEDDPRRADVIEIELAADRAAALTRQLLAFGRKQLLEPQVLDLNTVVRDMEKMLRRLIGEDIDIRIVSAPNLGRTAADPSQIEQVVMNLAVNARDAMPAGGTLTIETDNVDLDERYADAHAAVEPGSYVLLTVTDDGCGMDRETQTRIFEPFFTTKERGKGTGLGLSTVYGIVKQSGGYVWVYSDVGQGTTFRIYLPRVEGDVAAPAHSAAGGRVASGSETILVAEDEDTVRAVIARVLRQQGYAVLEAPDGGEALRICREHQGPIHLIVTDVIMPRVSGAEVAREVEVLRPEAKVLLMSGYTDGELERRGIVAERVAFLQKPFTPSSLGRRVREVLD